MSKPEYKRRNSRRRRHSIFHKLPFILASVAAVGAIGCGIYYVGKRTKEHSQADAAFTIASDINSPDYRLEEKITETETTTETEAASSEDTKIEELIKQADSLAAGYDYDGAIALLTEKESLPTNPQITEAIAGYESLKASLTRINTAEITHVFFHTLIMDNSKAFDGDSKTPGYNQVMTTKGEFLKILQSMYDKGFVLVKLHDIASGITGDDGTAKFTAGDIMLPAGKKAFVMSQDDVCYYEYMDGDGFASKIVIGEDGKPTCEMKMDDGSISTGSYDLVPLLEDFIQEHPDFSYKGARAVIAFTGYDGILGYRTAPKYSENPTYEQDRQTASAVAQCLRDNGWELASHSWGHRDMGKISLEDLKMDTNKWENEVESLIGATDIILFPFGSDIGGWQAYDNDNPRFQYLKSVGFRYFCNVDSSKYWVQLGDDHLRQGRRNLDGYRMYYDMIETDPTKRKLDDLFDVNEVFDKDRPTPVPPM